MSYLKKYVSKETKDINADECNMITNEDEAKAMTEHISCDCKCNSNRTIYNSKQKIIKHVNVNVKIIVNAKKIIVGILALAFVRIVSI